MFYFWLCLCNIGMGAISTFSLIALLLSIFNIINTVASNINNRNNRNNLNNNQANFNQAGNTESNTNPSNEIVTQVELSRPNSVLIILLWVNYFVVFFLLGYAGPTWGG